MDAFLEDLIRRLVDRSDCPPQPGGRDSSTSISWNAHREAEKLAEPKYVSELQTFIDRERDKDNRRAAYFALGHLAKNSADHAATQYLINRIGVETDKYTISALLDRIARLEKPSSTDLRPIFNALQRKEWLIRHSAIEALKFSNDPLAEEKLIEIIESSSDPSDICYANSTLNNMGTSKAVPYLEKHRSSRKRDVKLSATLAIEEIQKRSQRPPQA